MGQSDPLDPARTRAMHVLLDRSGEIEIGTALPAFYHQLYFWEAQPNARLGRDGHPKVGGIIPDLGLPRRMWAGGRLRFHQPLTLGQPATKSTVCETSVRKQGRSGPLGFVTLRHDFSQNGTLCVTEWQDLVYRQAPDPDAPAPVVTQAPTDAETIATRAFSTTDLFRYSALTFNGHRIHYDLDYATGVEGYRGLVVHGTLLAQILMIQAETELGPLDQFEFRATAPLMQFETASFCRSGHALWVVGPDRRLCMQARATVRGGS